MAKLKGRAWAVIDRKDNYLVAESKPNWGRMWIFQTRKQARDWVKNCFYETKGYKIVKLKIKEV